MDVQRSGATPPSGPSVSQIQPTSASSAATGAPVQPGASAQNGPLGADYITYNAATPAAPDSDTVAGQASPASNAAGTQASPAPAGGQPVAGAGGWATQPGSDGAGPQAASTDGNSPQSASADGSGAGTDGTNPQTAGRDGVSAQMPLTAGIGPQASSAPAGGPQASAPGGLGLQQSGDSDPGGPQASGAEGIGLPMPGVAGSRSQTIAKDNDRMQAPGTSAGSTQTPARIGDGSPAAAIGSGAMPEQASAAQANRSDGFGNRSGARVAETPAQRAANIVPGRALPTADSRPGAVAGGRPEQARGTSEGQHSVPPSHADTTQHTPELRAPWTAGAMLPAGARAADTNPAGAAQWVHEDGNHSAAAPDAKQMQSGNTQLDGTTSDASIGSAGTPEDPVQLTGDARKADASAQSLDTQKAPEQTGVPFAQNDLAPPLSNEAPRNDAQPQSMHPPPLDKNVIIIADEQMAAMRDHDPASIGGPYYGGEPPFRLNARKKNTQRSESGAMQKDESDEEQRRNRRKRAWQQALDARGAQQVEETLDPEKPAKRGGAVKKKKPAKTALSPKPKNTNL